MTLHQSIPAPAEQRELQEHRTLFLFSGILAVIIGIVAIVLPQIATLAAELFVGALLVAGGVVASVTAFRARGFANIAGDLLVGLLMLAAGVLLVLFPVLGVVSLTLFLAAYFLASGVLRIYYAWKLPQCRGRIWTIVGGLLSVALAVILWIALPEAAFWALGLIVGIDLIFYGFALIDAVRSANAAVAVNDN